LKLAFLRCGRLDKPCGAADCLKSFHEREGSFSAYGPDAFLSAVPVCDFCRSGESDFEVLLTEMNKHGIERIHPSACVRSCKAGLLDAIVKWWKGGSVAVTGYEDPGNRKNLQ